MNTIQSQLQTHQQRTLLQLLPNLQLRCLTLQSSLHSHLTPLTAFPQWLCSLYHTHPSVNGSSSDLRTRVLPISHLPALLISPVSSNMPKTTLGSRTQPTMLMGCMTNILVLMSLIRLTYRSLLALTLACHMVMLSVFRQLHLHGGRVIQSERERIMKMILHLFPIISPPHHHQQLQFISKSNTLMVGKHHIGYHLLSEAISTNTTAILNVMTKWQMTGSQSQMDGQLRCSVRLEYKQGKMRL